MKGLVNCTPDGLSLAQFQPSPVARVLVAKLRPLGETEDLS
jgi:hypothetical protein